MYSVLDTSDKYIRNKITRTPKCFSVFFAFKLFLFIEIHSLKNLLPKPT